GQARQPKRRRRRTRSAAAGLGPRQYEMRGSFFARHARAWPGHPRLRLPRVKTWMAGSSPAMTMEYVARPHSFRRMHLDRSGSTAAVARGIVHVLDIGLRQHIFARRD